MTDEHRALDVIYKADGLVALMREIDETLEAGRFAVVRSLLSAVTVKGADTRMLQGILRACLPARHELGEAYTRLVSLTHGELITKHGLTEADELMEGLRDDKPA